MNRVSFFEGRPRASQLKQWHLDMRSAVDDLELKVLDLIRQHAPVPDAVLGMTPDEVARYFEDARGELEAAACLMVLAEGEAVLRVDYLSRVYHNAKDPLSRAFRELYREKEDRVGLEQDLAARSRRLRCFVVDLLQEVTEDRDADHRLHTSFPTIVHTSGPGECLVSYARAYAGAPLA